ncbi:MAG: V-type ATPase subunit [Firmicutes bacterium]|nr:V-type ATPase subunit [Bacillota bacterium]
MSNWTSNAIITKAKSIYGTSLKQDDYLELVKKRSISEVVSYLKTKKYYKEFFSDVQENSVHRGQLEELIKKTNFNYTLRLIKFVELKDKAFYELNIIQREIDLILASIRAILSMNYEEAIAEFPIFFRRHASFDITLLSKARTFLDLLEAIEKTPFYSVLKPFLEKENSEIRYADIEYELDSCYYGCVFDQIEKNYKGKVKKQLFDIFKSRIELGNIVKIYRLKKFYNAEFSEIKKAVITKYSRMSDKKLDDIISLPNADSVLHYLESSEFAKYIDEDEYIYIEYYAEKMKYNLAKRYMYFSNDAPAVFSAYLILNEIERENLFNIIEGIRYNLEESEIKKMLIF